MISNRIRRGALSKNKIINIKKCKEYFAFISYKREDEKWAKWLQDKLEHYRFPTNLNGRTDLPKNIRPTFRDVTDLNPGLLTEEINNALCNSEWLIVVCSPRSAKSPWVCKEAQTFVDLGRADHIIPFVIEGNPFSTDTATECYPEALLNLTGRKELLAANINEMGRDAAVIKVVACMFNLRFDALWQRFERERKRKRIFLYLSISIIALISFCIAGWIWNQNTLLKEKDWKMMENQARYISEKANELVDKGDSFLARLLLLDVLPKDENSQDRPSVKEVDSILVKADMYNSARIFTESYGNHSIAFCHNDSELVSVLSPDEETIVQFWDANTGKCNNSFRVNRFFEPRMSLSPDNEKIAVWDLFYGHVDIYNYSGKLLQRLKEDRLNSVSFSTDGNRIVTSAFNNATKMWDINTGEILFTLYGKESVFSYDGCLVALTDGHSITIYDSNTGRPIRNIYDNAKSISSLAFSPDNFYIAYVSADSVIKIARLDSGKEVNHLNGHTHRITSISFSRDGRRLVSSSYDFTIKLWNIDRGICERTYLGDNLEVQFACFSNDGKRIVSAFSNNIIQIWDVGSKGRFRTLDGHSDVIESVMYSSDGKTLLSAANDNTIRVWDVRNGRCLKTIDVPSPGARTAIFSPDMKYIAAVRSSLSNEIWICDTQTGKCIKELQEPLNGNPDDATKTVQFSSDGKRIFSCSFLGATRVWDAKSGELIFTSNKKRNNNEYRPVAFSPDGKGLLEFSNDSTLQFLDLTSGRCVWDIVGYMSVNHITFSRSGNLIAIDNAHNICILESKTGRLLKKLTGNRDMATSITFSPDEKRVASTSLDWEVRIWDLDTGLCIQTLDGCNSVSFSPDGKHVAAVSEGNIICIWDCYTIQELRNKTRERFKNRQLTSKERRKYYLE